MSPRVFEIGRFHFAFTKGDNILYCFFIAFPSFFQSMAFVGTGEEVGCKLAGMGSRGRGFKRAREEIVRKAGGRQ